MRNPEDIINLPPSIDLICDTSAQPSVVSGYTNPLFDITNNGLGAIHILEYARPRRIPLIFWSSNRVYSADRLNALPRRETPTRFEYDPDAWNCIPVEQRPAGFHPIHGVSEEFSIDGGQRSIYGLSKLIADAACQEYAQAYDLPIIVNRFGVISGAGQFGHTDQGWVVWWAIAHWFKLPLTYLGWNGKQVRDILFVEDMLSALDLQLIQLANFRGEVFNLGGGSVNAVSLCEATRIMQEISSAPRLSPNLTRHAKATSSSIGPTAGRHRRSWVGAHRRTYALGLHASLTGFKITKPSCETGMFLSPRSSRTQCERMRSPADLRNL